MNNLTYFSINFYDLGSKTVDQFGKEFEMLSLKEFINGNELRVYHAFNDGAGNNYYFKLDEQDFHLAC